MDENYLQGIPLPEGINEDDIMAVRVTITRADGVVQVEIAMREPSEDDADVLADEAASFLRSQS